MTLPALPWVPGMVIAHLATDSQFMSDCAERLYSRSPSDVTKPYVTVQSTRPISLDGAGVAWSPLAQVDAYCAPATGIDPELVAWNIAASAARALARVRNMPYQSVTWSARLTDGPFPSIDDTRSDAVPLYRCTVRAELRIKIQ